MSAPSTAIPDAENPTDTISTATDLLSDAAHLLASDRREVFLRIEVVSGFRAIAFTTFVLGFLSFAFIWALFGYNFREKKHPNELFESDGLQLANLCVGCCCLLAEGLAIASFLWRLLIAHQASLRWQRRRRRMATFVFLSASVHAVNLILFIISNSWLLAKACSWFSPVVAALSTVEWTLWNTYIWLFLVMAASLCQWSPKHDAEHKDGAANLLVLDAPWTAYVWTLPMWFIFEASCLTPIALGLSERHSGSILLSSDLGPDCKRVPHKCSAPGVVNAFSSVWGVMFWLYAMQYYFYIFRTRYQLRQQGYLLYRTANILLQLQMRTAFLLFKVLLLSAALIWLARYPNCWTYLETVPGLLAMYLAGTSFCVVSLWLFTPKHADDHLLMELWLQDPAWTEAEKPAKDEDIIFLCRRDHDSDASPGLVVQSIYHRPSKDLTVDTPVGATLRNALSDLKAWQTAHPVVSELAHAGLKPSVHFGFYRAWTNGGLNVKVINCIRELWASGAMHRDAKVYITGHSLGGALAMLAAHDIHTELQPASMHIVTFGCPYVGNAAFRNDYNARLPDTWHLVHDGDPVPRTGKLFGLFKRPGKQVLVNQAGEMAVNPNSLEIHLQRGTSVANHYLTAYRLALLAICRMQFTVRGTAGGRAGVLAMSEDAALHEDMQRDGFEWAEFRKAARWGEPVLRRVRPPKEKLGIGSLLCKIVNPFGQVIEWHSL
ncbi:hypothetical protein WJX73_009654 [Symbiochloris irregularis]|uniref:Fungal lipase-type domain-containing protein n=1 Tax=Symbiochloris irregularis TaxID=706552 RepID=A0AAW1PQW5_9CHLO